MNPSNHNFLLRYSIVLLVFLQVSIGPEGALGSPRPLPASQSLVTALHVHSTWSTGSLTLDQLAEQGQELGIDAILLSDNFALRYEYGLQPFQGVLRKVITFPSLSPQDVPSYLEEIEAVQARHPGVILVPGLEVVPHYYWTGSLWQKNLTMHNAQRNLLVYGLNQPSQYSQLPTSGNHTTNRYGWETVSNVLPVLLLAPAGWLWRRAAVREGSHVGLKGVAVGLVVLSVSLLGNAWPFSQPIFSPYSKHLDYSPYQAVIDVVQKDEGMVIWSLPEARDDQRHSFGILGDVQITTAPHPEVLQRTQGFTGFGGLYQDGRSLHIPGGEWDAVLNQYQKGLRPNPPILFGEIAFHRPGQAGIELDQVLNVVQVTEQSARAVLNAMAGGNFFAVARTQKGVNLWLDTFQVECLDETCIAQAGDRLEVPAHQGYRIRVAVSARNGGAYPVSMTLIRSGEVIRTVKGHTPLQQEFIEKRKNPLSSSYYRVEIKGAGEILSNPIFVNPPPSESSTAGRQA